MIKEIWKSILCALEDWKDALMFAFSGEIPPVEVKKVETAEKHATDQSWFMTTDIETGESQTWNRGTEEFDAFELPTTSYWVSDENDVKPVPKYIATAFLKYELPFHRFICSNCNIENEIDNAILPNQVGVISCENCGLKWVFYAPPLQQFTLRDLPKDLQELWAQIDLDNSIESQKKI